jgi:hypothetical protein
LLLVQQHLSLNVEEGETAERRMASREVPLTESLWEEDILTLVSPVLMRPKAEHEDVLMHRAEEKGVDAEPPSGSQEATVSSPSIPLQ